MMKPTPLKNPLTHFVLALVLGLAACLAGCNTARPAGAENTYSVEQVRAIVQGERTKIEADNLTKDEADKGVKGLTSTWTATINTDPNQRAIETITHTVDIVSNAAFENLTNGSLVVHQSEALGVRDGEVLQLPVGIAFTVGEVGGSDFGNVPDQIAANAERDTARAAGAAAIIEIDGQRQAVLVEVAGRNRVAAIDAAGNAVSGVIVSASPIIRGIDAATQVLTIRQDDGTVSNHTFANPR